MGTRAIIRFFDTESATLPFAAVYEHSDGYPEGLGARLRAICKPLTDGLFVRDGAGSNGMGCFAATVVARLKRGAYGTYLCAPPQSVASGGYTYDLRPAEGHVACRLWAYDGKTVEYDGLLRNAPWSKEKGR